MVTRLYYRYSRTARIERLRTIKVLAAQCLPLDHLKRLRHETSRLISREVDCGGHPGKLWDQFGID